MSSASATTHTKLNFDLDPGAPPRRAPTSGYKCILLISAILVPLGIIFFLARIASNTMSNFSEPHRALYQNTSLEEATNRALVVQPLITHEQTFDIAATVWMRKIEGKGHDSFAVNKTGDLTLELDENTSSSTQSQEIEVQESVLFSDIVFRGLHLTDKNVFNTINFTLPTALFRKANLSNYDLRGSFVLIPSPPSLLDHVTNYSSWIPDKVKLFPVIPWPFPLGSSHQHDKTLVDRVIEKFSITVPLLEFHSIPTRCEKPAMSSNDKIMAGVDELVDDDDDNDDDEMEPKDKAMEDTKTRLNKMSRTSSLHTTNGKPPLESHPYITTRTQIYVADQVNLFNRKAYTKAHKKLKSISCGQKVMGVEPNRYMCESEYRVNGHWETQLELVAPSKKTGRPQTEWAYAPFITYSKISPQKDLLVVPVNRENCTELKPQTVDGSLPEEQEFINVAWKVSYSGLTGGKLVLLDTARHFHRHNVSKSEHAQAKSYDTVELIYGVFGQRFDEDTHPRRRVILAGFRFFISAIITCFEIRYWYTRPSTISISILGTTLIACSILLTEVVSLVSTGRSQEFSVLGWISAILFYAVTTFALPLMMIKAVYRLDFVWWKGNPWVPIVCRGHATHRERASERLEAKTPWPVKAGIFLSLVVIYYTITPHNYHVIQAILPAPPPDEVKERLVSGSLPLLSHPINITGKILQLILNFRSKSYAGTYKISAILMIIFQIARFVALMPALVGRYGTRVELPAQTIIDAILALITAWQALTLPSVSQTSEDEHSE